MAAPGMAQASFSTRAIPEYTHLLHASRGTCTSMYIALAMTGIFGLSKCHLGQTVLSLVPGRCGGVGGAVVQEWFYGGSSAP